MVTAIEFKAWFDGFTDQITDVPTAYQWSRIKDEIKKIYDYPKYTHNIVNPTMILPYNEVITIGNNSQQNAVNPNR